MVYLPLDFIGLPVLAAFLGFTDAAASAKVFPALNLTIFLAGIFIVFPVAGLRPSRAARFVTENDPNPTN